MSGGIALHYPAPKVEFVDISDRRLEVILELVAPAFSIPDEAFRQLRYLDDYTAKIGAVSLAIERTYIDRDFIEDHAAFYARSLHPYPNYCHRIHFFSASSKEVEDEIMRVLNEGIRNGKKACRDAAVRLSSDRYLGFAIIKPLAGTPVGRTILKTYPKVPQSDNAEQYLRDYSCTRSYPVHLLGIELTINGLAFQQQDVGVSACATTAVWSSLQKAREREEVTYATPAQITQLACRYSLPFGRAMPSEGLNTDQMCNAINALGVSPQLWRVDRGTGAFESARGYVHSAIRSFNAPILLLRHDSDQYHAVTVAGMKVAKNPDQTALDSTGVKGHRIYDHASKLIGLYIHDDRLGPYISAELICKEGKAALKWMANGGEEIWTLTQLLIPMHGKIRLSFSGLRQVAIKACVEVSFLCQLAKKDGIEGLDNVPITFSSRILRAHEYSDELLFENHVSTPEDFRKYLASVPQSRYLGIIEIKAGFMDPIDILVDTTSTRRNAHCLGIVALSQRLSFTHIVRNRLATWCCKDRPNACMAIGGD